MKIKDLFLCSLNESKDNFLYLDDKSIKEVTNVVISKSDNYVRIDFVTSYDKHMSMVANYDDFMNWYSKNKSKATNPEQIFNIYIQDFVNSSPEINTSMADINEIVDDNGDIMPSTDLPSNATNSMVGDKIKWDLERVYQSFKPKSIRYYPGSSGVVGIVW